MRLTEELVAHLATEIRGTTVFDYAGRQLDLTPPWRRATMFELVAEHAGVDVWALIRLANRHPRVNILQPGPGAGESHLTD